MSGFTYKEIYIEDGKRLLEVNVLPEKYCNFDCIFCQIGRSYNKLDIPQSFNNMEESLIELKNKVEDNKIELVFINSKGEVLLNDKIYDIINLIKGMGVPVRLLSNGYLLGKNEYIKLANMCDEVIGELKTITEEDFKKIQRPIEGYTIEEYISNMILFNKQYQRRFIFEVTIIKGYNDTEQSINKIKNIINELSPDKVIIERMNDEKFKKKLGISDYRYEEICKLSLNN